MKKSYWSALVCVSLGFSCLAPATQAAPLLLNVNFGSNTKTGYAAVGLSPSDYWNLYQIPWVTFGSLPNLRWSDSSVSSVGLYVSNAPGIWGFNNEDPMYNNFIYPWDGASLSVTVTNLPPNKYDFYLYGHSGADVANSAFQFYRGGAQIGFKGTTHWGWGWNSTNWEAGQQYVVFKGVGVTNQSITVVALPVAIGNYAYINGMQIVPSQAITPPPLGSSNLINIDFAGNSADKVGFAAVGLSTNDFWNGYNFPWYTVGNLPRLTNASRVAVSGGLTVLNAPGTWGWDIADAMYRSYSYPGDGGNITATLTNLGPGNYDFYLYGHSSTDDDNTIFHLWTGERDCDTKGTTIWGSGANSTNWDEGQQYVVFRGVTVESNQPVVILAGHSVYGYANFNGMQIVYKGPADTDHDGLPDAWERQYFGNLNQTASGDFDGDGLNNLREYQLSTNPTRTDTDYNGVSDADDAELAWVEDATPTGGYELADNESWSWTDYWWDGSGWGGNEVYPYSGSYMHMSDLFPGDLHQHYFYSSVITFMARHGDSLYAYVNLDPSYSPNEVMLQWYVTDENGNGSWEHRAYWGENLIEAGQTGTASRYYAGALPTAGNWVRLEVPASAVGLEGKIVQGMAFTLWGGRAAWDRAGRLIADVDGNGLPDSWERQYFGHTGVSPSADADSDGLTNLQEYQYGTDPTSLDTDHDGLSDGGEVFVYHTSPTNPHTFNLTKNDGQYLFTAELGKTDSKAQFHILWVSGNMAQFSITGADPGDTYDIYTRPDLNPGTKYRLFFASSPGQTIFTCPIPPGIMNFFTAGHAGDEDADCLKNGYEELISFSVVDKPDSDSDGLPDAWEAQWGLNAASNTGGSGPLDDPDNDGINNQTEYANHTDPWRTNSNPRPVVSVSVDNPTTFRFTRTGTVGDLTVYYTVGGTATYGSDYALDPSPTSPNYPFSLVISNGQSFRTLTVTNKGCHLPETVMVALVPFSVPALPATPASWAYVVDPCRDRTNVPLPGICIYECLGSGPGILINLRSNNCALEINPLTNTAPLPFVNLASSGRGTVTRIEITNKWDNTNATRIVGEYLTSPGGAGNPSRTTVDRYGNVWVGNRDISDENGGSITEIGVVLGGTRGTKSNNVFYPDPKPLPAGQLPGEWIAPPFIYNTCVDRDGDGLIHTSRGLSNLLAWSNETLPPGDADEAIIRYVRTTPTGIRTVAVDRDNNIWVGSQANGWHEFIDAVTGAPVTGQKYGFGTGGYGGVVDPYSVLWSAGYSSFPDNSVGVLRLVSGPVSGIPRGAISGVISGTTQGYGMGIDPATADVWVGDYDRGGLWQVKQTGCTVKVPFAAADNPSGNELKGVVVDGKGNVWAAHATGSNVYRLKTTGEYLGSVLLNHPTLPGVVGQNPYGVCVDSCGMIWAVCFAPADSLNETGFYAMRIDPTQGVDPNTGKIVGRVVTAIDLGRFPTGAGPYNYSDMTGFVPLSTTQPAGVWDFVQDSSTTNTRWSSLTLQGTGTLVSEVRAADRITDLTSWPFRAVTAGAIPAGIKGRYLEVRVNLLRDFGAPSGATLRSLSVAWNTPGSALQITNQPQNRIVAVGDPATFTVRASGFGLTYQWFKTGSETVLGTNSSYTVSSAQFTNAGKYWVRVADTNGTFLDSAEARLHVNSTPYSSRVTVSADPLSPILGQPVTFSASLYAGASPEPVYYQWRKHGLPVTGPGTSGQCAFDGYNYTASYTVAAVQCSDIDYSVIFTNQFWKVTSPDVNLSVYDPSYQQVPQVTITPASVEVVNIYQPPTLQVTNLCFTPICAQWYKCDSMGGRYWKILIPNATGLSYTLPNPVTCDAISYYTVDVFDEAGVAHTPGYNTANVYGNCQ